MPLSIGRQTLISHQKQNTVAPIINKHNVTLQHYVDDSSSARFLPQDKGTANRQQHKQCHASAPWADDGSSARRFCHMTRDLFYCNKNTMPCFSTMSRWQFTCQESLPQDNNTSTTTQTMPSHASASYTDDGSSSLGLCHRQGNNVHCNKNTMTYFSIMHRWQFFCRRTATGQGNIV